MSGADFRKKRLQHGLSQAKLAKLVHIKQARLSAFELEKKDLSKEEKQLIHSTLDSLDSEKLKEYKTKKYRVHQRHGSILASRPRRSFERTSRNKQYLELLAELHERFHQRHNLGLKALSFFAGCGGLCYGVKAAGIDIVATNEIHPAYRNIYQMNFAEANFLPNDITEITDEVIAEVMKEHPEIDLIIGGPPCQGFSLAGKRDINDKRNTLFQNYLHIAKQVKPKVILMENVRLMTSMKDPNGEYVSKRVLDLFQTIGYNSSFYLLNAKDFSVPQHRERVIFIGVRQDLHLPPSIPHFKEMKTTSTCNKLAQPHLFTFGDAVSDLEYLESGEKSETDQWHQAVHHPDHVLEWLIDVPQGKSAHDNIDESLRPPSGYNTTYKRQIWDQPSSTVSTTYGMISGCRNVHPIATRSLTTREALRLQSFPDSFKLIGKLGDIRTTIGNAVPPLLAYALAQHLKDCYLSTE